MHESPKKYHLQWWMKILAVLLIIVAIFVPRICVGPQFWFFTVVSSLLIIICVGSWFVEYKINDKGSRAMIGPFTIRKVRWEDISKIYDDHFGGVHLYTFLTSKKWWRRYFGYNNAGTNYKDFLRESISRVHPDTEVENSILDLIGFTERDVGKKYKGGRVHKTSA